MSEFTHINPEGKATMVDVGSKATQLRIARAEGSIRLGRDTLRMIRENLVQKGDVLTVAQIAGIQAAKQTAGLIPLCHNLMITKVDVKLELSDDGVKAVSSVHCIGQTGVEMEALTAVSVALLTVYDMCKAVDKNMIIESIQLVEKTKQDL